MSDLCQKINENNLIRCFDMNSFSYLNTLLKFSRFPGVGDVLQNLVLPKFYVCISDGRGYRTHMLDGNFFMVS